MAPAAKESKATGAKAAKAAPKSKAAATKAAKDTTAATPKKGRKRAADTMEESAPAHVDAPAKQAKKDGARKAKAKAKEEATATTVAVEAPPPKAKKAKTTKAAEGSSAGKVDGESKPAKATKKKADAEAAKAKKAATPKSPTKKEVDEADAKPKKATKTKATAAEGAAPKSRKRKASAVEDAEGKAKTVISSAAKKAKTGEDPAIDESQSLLDLVGASLQSVSKRMSGLFSVLGTVEDDAANANGTPKEKKKPATKKSGSKAKAAAAPSGEDKTAAGDRARVTELADSDIDLQDDDPATAILRGFESSDEEAASGDEGFAPGKLLPKLPKSKSLAKKLKGAAGTDDTGPGVVYIGHIPHGFHEQEMRAYFTQFGPVEHVRLSRSKKTGASKHYAFLQFRSAETASIAAETMNNYLMFGHILKCHVVPPSQVHPNLWVGADRRFKPVPWAKIQGRRLEEPKGRSEWQDKIDAETNKRSAKAKKLQALGYDFEPPQLKNASAVPARAKRSVQQASSSVVTTAGGGQVVEAEATEVALSRRVLLAAQAEAGASEDEGMEAAPAAVDDAVRAKAKPGRSTKKVAAAVKAKA